MGLLLFYLLYLQIFNKVEIYKENVKEKTELYIFKLTLYNVIYYKLSISPPLAPLKKKKNTK